MLRQIISDYHTVKKEAFIRALKKQGAWIFNMIIYGIVFPLSNSSIYSNPFLPIFFICFGVTIFYAEMYPNILPKMLYLCPLDRNQKKSYLYQAYWFKVCVSILFDMGVILIVSFIYHLSWLIALSMLLFHIEYVLVLHMTFFRNRGVFDYLEALNANPPDIWKRYHNEIYSIMGILIIEGALLFAIPMQKESHILQLTIGFLILAAVGGKVIQHMIKTYLPHMVELGTDYEKTSFLTGIKQRPDKHK